MAERQNIGVCDFGGLRLPWYVSFACVVFLHLVLISNMAQADEAEEKLKRYQQNVRPVMQKHCYDCHNEADKKGGLSLADYDFVVQIIRDGARFVKVMDQVRSGNMPPSQKPRLSPEERDALLNGLDEILADALAEPDPGQVVLRRLSNREYRYSIQDLLGLDFETRGFFPDDGSGGEGFDNQARVLYLTPLTIERYYEAAERIVDSLALSQELWRRIVPNAYQPGLAEKIRIWWHRIWHNRDVSLEKPGAMALSVLIPFATRAYRRFLNEAEEDQLLNVFSRVYSDIEDPASGFDAGIRESLKMILISPHFLYRHENDLPLDKPYQINNFELASRLSFFLWSSIPDDTLLTLAYRRDLHRADVVAGQVERMLRDPRALRFSESFAGQWLGIDKILDRQIHEVDLTLYPSFSDELSQSMHREAVLFFHHVLTKSKTFLDLIDSDYTFVNQTLAAHYDIDGFTGETFQRVKLEDPNRGGILGLSGVLTATSFPLRTSPVVRGKWVLEQILGTPPPPPPPDVPELEEARDEVHDELDLRSLLARHRAPSTCHSCHQKMDPIGLGLENFDAIGRWRTTYGTVPIESSGILVTGESFQGPAELKEILLQKKELFARNFTRKMLSYALGRGIQFQDKLTVDALSNSLLENDFDTVRFITDLVLSYPFRFKKSDRDI